jgi:uncharacterized membrane-anchored protein
MEVKDFINLIDLETLNNQEITIIIPITEKATNGVIENIGNCNLSVDEKIVFNDDENSIYDVEKYENFGIEPCFKSDDESSMDYETVDVRTSEDNYKYIFNDYGDVWVVIN